MHNNLAIKNPIIRTVPIGDVDSSRVSFLLESTFGEGFSDPKDVEESVVKSKAKNGENLSFCAINESGELVGARITYASEYLKQEYDSSLLKLGIDPCRVAYFSTLGVLDGYRGMGIGPALSNKSINAIKRSGHSHILTHCWKESPGDSSFKYLSKMGFKKVREIPNMWAGLNYKCTGCEVKPCICTAIEMIMSLD